jgi:2,3-dihydroxybenzoate decarboxylase
MESEEPLTPNAAREKPYGKIALEEHFMVPDFVEYFAETYPNISPEIAKLGRAALQEFGDKRISIMDETGLISWSCPLPVQECRLKGTRRLRRRNHNR